MDLGRHTNTGDTSDLDKLCPPPRTVIMSTEEEVSKLLSDEDVVTDASSFLSG